MVQWNTHDPSHCNPHHPLSRPSTLLNLPSRPQVKLTTDIARNCLKQPSSSVAQRDSEMIEPSLPRFIDGIRRYRFFEPTASNVGVTMVALGVQVDAEIYLNVPLDQCVFGVRLLSSELLDRTPPMPNGLVITMRERVHQSETQRAVDALISPIDPREQSAVYKPRQSSRQSKESIHLPIADNLHLSLNVRYPFHLIVSYKYCHRN